MKIKAYCDRLIALDGANWDFEYYLRSEYDFQVCKDNPTDLVLKGTPQRLYSVLVDLSELVEVELC